MAINMARISGGTVVNIESWGDNTPETGTLKYIEDKPVRIGDSYRNGKYFRDNEEVLLPLQKENQDLIEALGAVAEALYEADLASIEEQEVR